MSGSRRRPTDWGRRFGGAPERYPSLRLAGFGPGGVLLWDGQCGFCAFMVDRLRRFLRTPIRAVPYQEVADRLPVEVLEHSVKQMHFVDESGRIVGGSLALVACLRAGARPRLAAVLGARPVAPLLWLAYRLVATHRHAAGSLVGTACAIEKAQGSGLKAQGCSGHEADEP